MTETDNKYREDFVIPSYLVDGSRKLSPNSMLLVFQELAYRGAASLGFGDDILSSKGLAWVLSRIRFTIRRRPALGEKVRLETWHKGLSGLFFLRDYRILDADGQPLVDSTSSFVVINYGTREMVRAENGLSEIISLEPQCVSDAIATPADRLAVRGEDWEESPLKRTVGYSDTDFVGHVNNASYLKWMLDFEHFSRPDADPTDITINFSRETLLGDTVGFRRCVRPDGIYHQVVMDGAAMVTARLQN